MMYATPGERRLGAGGQEEERTALLQEQAALRQGEARDLLALLWPRLTEAEHTGRRAVDVVRIMRRLDILCGVEPDSVVRPTKYTYTQQGELRAARSKRRSLEIIKHTEGWVIDGIFAEYGKGHSFETIRKSGVVTVDEEVYPDPGWSFVRPFQDKLIAAGQPVSIYDPQLDSENLVKGLMGRLVGKR